MKNAINNIIEELFDPLRLGRQHNDGRFAFPYTRNARIAQLKRYYNFNFPEDLPRPYSIYWQEYLSKQEQTKAQTNVTSRNT